MMGVADQLDLCPQVVPWEELSEEGLKEEVVRVHNTIFGQLGSLGFHMKECGVGEDVIKEFLMGMCERTQLGEDQVVALLEMVSGDGGGGRSGGSRQRVSAATSIEFSTSGIGDSQSSITTSTGSTPGGPPLPPPPPSSSVNTAT